MAESPAAEDLENRMSEPARRPSWLKPERPGDNFHYANGCTDTLVIYPCSADGKALLDGKFTAAELREIARWVGVPPAISPDAAGGALISELREITRSVERPLTGDFEATVRARAYADPKFAVAMVEELMAEIRDLQARLRAAAPQREEVWR